MNTKEIIAQKVGLLKRTFKCLSLAEPVLLLCFAVTLYLSDKAYGPILAVSVIVCLGVVICCHFLIWQYKWTINSAQKLQATNEDCDAGDAWQEYLLANPRISRDDPGFQRLVRKQIKARKFFAKVHKLPVKEHTDYLRQLFRTSKQ